VEQAEGPGEAHLNQTPRAGPAPGSSRVVLSRVTIFRQQCAMNVGFLKQELYRDASKGVSLLFEKLWKMFAVSFKHVIEDFLNLVGFRADGVNKQRLIGRVAVAMNCCFHG
jgi:hypothetical protein